MALEGIASWAQDFAVPNAAAVVIDRDGVLETFGDQDRPFPLASVTKLLTAYLVLIAVEEGAIGLDDSAGPPGATVRHLMAHAAGYAFETDGAIIARPGARRIYSNRGIEELAAHLDRQSGIPFGEYLQEGVLEPLGLSATRLAGSAASAGVSTAGDLAGFARELLAPQLLADSSLAAAVEVQFPGLSGVLPGIGRFDPLDWGLGFERNFSRPKHWAGSVISPAAFGHFGASGTFLWVDPSAGLACACLTDRDFGPWALQAWPVLSNAVLS